MVNWVSRRDLSDAAKGGTWFVAVALVVGAVVVMGAWYWVTGPSFLDVTGWRRALEVAGRVVLLGGCLALAQQPGAWASVGGLAMVGLCAAGFLVAERRPIAGAR
jgi:hypothetical protein